MYIASAIEIFKKGRWIALQKYLSNISRKKSHYSIGGFTIMTMPELKLSAVGFKEKLPI